MIHGLARIKKLIKPDKLVTKTSIIGLDIGPKEIRVIEGDIEASIPTPEGAVLDGVIVNVKEVSEAVKELFRSKGIANKDVATAVSGKGVVLRLTNVPAIGPEGIKDIIKDEASKYIVFAGSELLTDFYSIEEISEEGSRKLKVLSVAARKEIIDSYVETIKLAELNLQAVDVGSLTLSRAISSKESLSSGITVLAAVEYNTATIFIFKDSKIHYLHNVDPISELNSEIGSITGFCKNEFGEGVEIKKIISTDLKEISIAKGLALRDTGEDKFPVKINLLPLEEIRIKEFNSQAFQFLKALGVIVSILILYFFFLRFQTWLSFRNIAAIQDDLKKPNPVLDKLLDVERMDKLYTLEMKEQKRIILKAESEDWGELLQEIKRIIPKRAYLMSIKSDEKDVVIFKGKAVNQNSVFDLVHSLKESWYFADIKLQESKDEETKEDTRAYFVLKCLLRVESKEN